MTTLRRTAPLMSLLLDREGPLTRDLARAKALLDNRDELRKDDCRVLRYAGNTPEALRDLAGVIDSMIA